MGAQASKAAEASAASTKLSILRLSDEYLSFIESTTVEIGESLVVALWALSL